MGESEADGEEEEPLGGSRGAQGLVAGAVSVLASCLSPDPGFTRKTFRIR